MSDLTPSSLLARLAQTPGYEREFHASLSENLIACLSELYDQERRYLAGHEQTYQTIVLNFLANLHDNLPTWCTQTPEAFCAWTDAKQPPLMTVPLYDVLPDIRRAVFDTCKPFYADHNLFAKLRKQFGDAHERLCNKRHSSRAISVRDFDGTARDCVDGFLAWTPFLPLFYTKVPLEFPVAARMEHQWIVGSTGSGKTNALKTLIFEDIFKMMDDECSIVVIDSQNSLIPDFASLKAFAPGEPLYGRLVHLDPHDVDYPTALGLFDLNMETSTSLEKVQQQTTAVELLEFTLSSLVEQELTGQMKTLLRFLIIALLAIPNATIHTMVELLEKSSKHPFPEHIARVIQSLAPVPRNFFERQFDTKEFQVSKDGLLRRLYGLLSNPVFDRMFSHPRSKFRLKEEISQPKLILLDTAKDVFGEDGAEMLGRFFISLIGQAAQQRKAEAELPCYVYIDEAGDYLGKESIFARILDQARKKNIGLIVSHQRLIQIAPGTLDALQANTRIKLASVQDRDAHVLARDMHTTPDRVMRKNLGNFAAYIHGITPAAVDVQFPLTDLSTIKMSSQEATAIRADMRRLYSADAPEPKPQPQPQQSTPRGSKW